MRKIIQLIDTVATVNDYGYLVALCNDGSVWYFTSGKWVKMEEAIPQD